MKKHRGLYTLSVFFILFSFVITSLGTLGVQPVSASADTTSAAETGDGDDVTIASFSCSAVTEIPQAECEALVALYENTTGANWTAKDGWLENATPCSWYGITCESDHVTEIILNENNLVGTIPDGMSALTSLNLLDLSANSLTGSIPTWLGTFTSLDVLELSTNDLSGSIPTELGNMTDMDYFSVSGNSLTGTIPAALSNMTHLEHLVLHNNHFTGTLPTEIGTLTGLVYLTLDVNEYMSGSLPESLINLVNLETLYFSNTSLCEPPSEAFQTWLAGITDIRRTSPCSDEPNKPSLVAPTGNAVATNFSWIADSTALSYQLSVLDASNASVIDQTYTDLTSICIGGTCSVPSPSTLAEGTYTWSVQITSATGSAWSDSLSFTQLSSYCAGVTEISLAECDALVALYENTAGANWTAKDGWLENATPCRWYGITCESDHVTGIVLNANNLVGTIPDAMSVLTSLNLLDLSANSLTGSIPTWLGTFTSLDVLDLSTNGFSGSIPTELGNMTDMDYFSMSGNSLTGTIPASLGNLSHLEYLILHNNQFTGTLPTEIGNLTGLVYLSANANEFMSGSLPESLINLVNLETFYFSNTSLCEPASETFQTWLSGIEYVLGTSICSDEPNKPSLVTPTGTVFAANFSWVADSAALAYRLSVLNASNVSVIDQTYTDLTSICIDGTCSVASPSTLAEGTYTWSVQITSATGSAWSDSLSFTIVSDYCSLVTEIPQAECDALVALYENTAGANWTAKDGWLENATPCRWYGITCESDHVTEIILNENNLVGTIPDGMSALTSLNLLDLSANSLTGSIPTWLGTFTSLDVLELSTNDLSGSIPTELGNMTDMDYFSVSGNSLTGTIPAALSNMTHLEHLVLHNNHFTGTLPTEIGTLTGLVYLTLDVNEYMSGSLPESLINLVNLETLYFSNTSLCEPPSEAFQTWLAGITDIRRTSPCSTLPTKPAGIAPNDETIDNWSPTFSWNKTSDAMQYQLYIYQEEDSVVTDIFNQTYAYDLAACDDDNICEITPDLTLTYGKFYWEVRGVNAVGAGEWSSTLPFWTPDPPRKITLVSPSGTIDDWTTTFVWKADSLASSYQLIVRDSAFGSTPFTEYHNHWYTPEEAACGDASTGGTCSVSGITINGASAVWYVRGQNLSGTGDWSDPFTITPPPAPGQITLVSPIGTSASWSPSFTWNEEAISTSYQFHLYKIGTTNTDILQQEYTAEEAACADDGICTITPNLSLAIGKYAWTVAGKNAAGTGEWAAALSFNTPGVPGKVTLVSPIGTSASWNPTFTWNQDPSIQSYQLYIYQKSGTTVTVIHKAWYTADAAACNDDGVCKITPAITLGSGTYSWTVRGKNLVGTGAWSTTEAFTTPAKPSQVTTIAPTGAVTTWSPTFSWNTDALAQSYTLYIYKKSGTTVTEIHKAAYTAETAVCSDDGVCEITPAVTLGGGTYYWQVRGVNPSGKGAWSAAKTFNTPAKPGQVTTVSPLETSGSWTPTFSWNQDALAQSYQLYIFKKSGTNVTTVHSGWYTAETAVCSDDDVCEITPAVTLGGGTYYWKVRGKNPSGKGAWSATQTFTTPAVPGQITLIPPSETSGSGKPAFSWNEDTSAQSYQLYIYKVSGSTVTSVHKAWYTAEVAVCGDDGVCTITPGITLASGNYYWKVRGKNPSGNGAWSEPLPFNIAQ